MKKKYLVLAGFGQSGFLTASQVQDLYGVDPEECVLADPRRPETFKDLPKGLTILRPKCDGKYQVPEPRLRVVK